MADTTAGSINIKLTADGSSVNAVVDNVKSKFSELGTHGVSSMQAVSASIRIAEGGLTNSLRAAERFLASFESIRTVAQAAFPVVGFLAVGEILARMVEKIEAAVEAFKKLQRAPLEIAASFAGLTSSIRLQNAELDVTNERLQQAINKIQGKPNNNFKLAIYEARVEAEKLSNSLREAFMQMEENVKKNATGQMTAFFTGGQDTKYIEDYVQKNVDKLNSNAIDIADPIERKKQDEIVRSSQETWLRAELTRVQKLQTEHNSILTESNMSRAQRGAGPRQDTDYSPNVIPMLRNLLIPTIGLGEQETKTDTGMALKNTLEGLQDNKSNNEPLKAYREALEAARAGLAALKAEAASAGSEDPLVKGLEAGAAKASMEISRLNQALKEGNHAPLTDSQSFALYQADTNAGIQKALNDSSATRARELNALNDRMLKDMTEIDEKHQSTLATIQQEIIASQQLAAASAKGPSAEAQARIELELAKIPDQDIKDATRVKLQDELASSVGTTTRSIKEQTDAINDEIAAYGKGIDVARALELAHISTSGKDPGEIAALLSQQQAKNRLEDISSGSSRGGGSFTDGLQQWAAEWQDSMQSAARITRDTLGSAVEGLNDQLSKLVTNQKTSFASMFMGIAESMAKTGIKTAEGVGMKILFGDSASNQKPDGTAANPLHVIMAGGLGSAADIFNPALPGAPEFKGGGGALGAIAAAAAGGGGGGKGGFGGFGASGILGGLIQSLASRGSGGSAPDQLDYNLPAAWQNPGAGIGGVSGGSGSSAGTISGIGGFFSSILSSLIPHFAAGGSTGSGPILVGDGGGPEIFNPGPAGGTITPNNKIGGVTNVYNVDARGSNDSNLTRSQVVAGLKYTHQSAVSQSMTAMKEQQKRRPIGA